DLTTGQIASWSQKSSSETPIIFVIGYDAADQIISAFGSQNGKLVKTFAYTYDLVGNRLTEQVDQSVRHFSYNALNELTSSDDTGQDAVTFEWDAAHRLTSLSSANDSTQFSYDGLGRCVGIRRSVNGVEVSNRRLVWCENDILEE